VEAGGFVATSHAGRGGWHARDDETLRLELDGAWQAMPTGTITDDDLLRFFSVLPTDGMLG
jgi:hypothetical protein